MAQYSVILSVLAVSIFIAHTLCFRVEPELNLEPEIQAEARQMADNVLVIQDEAQQVTTPAASLPNRIRDTVLNGLRDFGNHVRTTPARVTECFQNITKCAQTILRRNQTANAGTLLVHEE